MVYPPFIGEQVIIFLNVSICEVIPFPEEYYVTPHDGKWQVKKEKGKRATSIHKNERRSSGGSKEIGPEIHVGTSQSAEKKW
jgi:hypothetical protein